MIQEYQIKKTRRPIWKVFLLGLLLLVLVTAGFGVYYYAKIHRPVGTGSTQITFSVPKGASTRQVGQELSERGLIINPNVFLIYARFTGAAGKIQAGDYILNTNMSMSEMLDILTSGKVTRNEKRITFTEGWSNKQFAARLDDLGLATEDQFNDAVKSDFDFDFSDEARMVGYEGFLFPDTYSFDANLDARAMIQRMLENFESKISADMRAEIVRRNLNPFEIIVMASIIEREVGRAPFVSLTPDVLARMQEERQIVSSIFYNRLRAGMPLQSDATVNYATGKSDRRALLSDLEFDSPYNTYKYAGLPPGPISNPGLNAIRAAIYPADTDYLYFLNNQEGTAYFGRTLEEHNRNRELYLD
jgi:UPF0755 protein